MGHRTDECGSPTGPLGIAGIAFLQPSLDEYTPNRHFGSCKSRMVRPGIAPGAGVGRAQGCRGKDRGPIARALGQDGLNGGGRLGCGISFPMQSVNCRSETGGLGRLMTGFERVTPRRLRMPCPLPLVEGKCSKRHYVNSCAGRRRFCCRWRRTRRYRRRTVRR